jgi:hypothetical protein
MNINDLKQYKDQDKILKGRDAFETLYPPEHWARQELESSKFFEPGEKNQEVDENKKKFKQGQIDHWIL